MKRIFITGGSGFIGRNLKEYLQNKYPVFAPTHKELDLLEADKVRNYIMKKKVDMIIHCANIGGGRDRTGQRDIVKTNMQMFFNIVRNEDLAEKIIYFGSGAEYDKSRPLQKIKEEDFGKNIPSDDYGFYKYVCGKYIEKSEKIINLRLFGVYGKYENYLFKFISNAIIKNLLKIPLKIGQNVYFDYLYIVDLVKIAEYFLDHQARCKSYNLTPNESVSLLQICNMVNDISSYKSCIKTLESGYNNKYTGDNSRLKREMRNLEFTDYKEGIKSLFLYYQKRLGKIDRKIILEDKYLKFIQTRKEQP